MRLPTEKWRPNFEGDGDKTDMTILNWPLLLLKSRDPSPHITKPETTKSSHKCFPKSKPNRGTGGFPKLSRSIFLPTHHRAFPPSGWPSPVCVIPIMNDHRRWPRAWKCWPTAHRLTRFINFITWKTFPNLKSYSSFVVNRHAFPLKAIVIWFKVCSELASAFKCVWHRPAVHATIIWLVVQPTTR